MSEVTTLFGYIEAPGFVEGLSFPDYCRLINEHNKRVIESLPSLNDEYPHFIKDMFNILPWKSNFQIGIPMFEEQIIGFAATYHDMMEIDPWILHAFEDLLSRLYWSSAHLYISTMGMIHSYSWYYFKTDPDIVTAALEGKPLGPPETWERDSYIYTPEKIPWSEGIDNPQRFPEYKFGFYDGSKG